MTESNWLNVTRASEELGVPKYKLEKWRRTKVIDYLKCWMQTGPAKTHPMVYNIQAIKTRFEELSSAFHKDPSDLTVDERQAVFYLIEQENGDDQPPINEAAAKTPKVGVALKKVHQRLSDEFLCIQRLKVSAEACRISLDIAAKALRDAESAIVEGIPGHAKYAIRNAGNGRVIQDTEPVG